MTEEILRVENQKGLDPRAISIRQGDTTELTVKLIGLETGGLSGKVYLVKDELKYFEESVIVDKDGAVSFSIKDNLPAGQYDLEIIVGSKHKFPSAYYSFIVTIHPSVEYAEENLIQAYGKKELIADVSKIVKQGAKGESGESITIKGQSKDSQGNSVVEFSDGTTVTVNKGDKGDQGDQGPRGIQGPKGDPLNVETGEIVPLPRQVIDLSEGVVPGTGKGSLIMVVNGGSATLHVDFTPAFTGRDRILLYSDFPRDYYSSRWMHSALSSYDDSDFGLLQIASNNIYLMNVKEGVQYRGSMTWSLETDISAMSGPKGDTGPRGPKGPAGPAGPKGDPATETFTKSVADKLYPTIADLDNKSDLKVMDTRNDDRNPLWYMNNYGSKQVFEFKYRRNVGNPPLEASAGSAYTIILTRVPWRDKSGGYPTQLSFGERIALRIGTSETTWGPWKTLATLDDVNDIDTTLRVGVNKYGNVGYQKSNDEKWYLAPDSTGYGYSVALKDHTHEEYLKKGEPITLTAKQKAELKGDRGLTGPRGATGSRGATGAKGADGTSITTWVGTESQYNALSTKSSTTLYIITE